MQPPYHLDHVIADAGGVLRAVQVRISCHSHKHPALECAPNILPKLRDQTSFDHNLKLGRSTLFRSMAPNWMRPRLGAVVSPTRGAREVAFTPPSKGGIAGTCDQVHDFSDAISAELGRAAS